MRHLLSFTLIASLLFVSCKKDEPTAAVIDNNVTAFKDLKVPSNFKFETSKNINLSISTEDEGFNTSYLIKVYDFYPSAGGNLIYSGFTSSSLNASIKASSNLDKLYLVKENPDGSSKVAVVSATGNSVSYAFEKGKNKNKTFVTSPDCTTGCDVSYNNHSSDININTNDPGGIYCLTGNHTGKINVNRGGVTIRICGTANITDINLNNGSGLEVVDGASLTVKNLNQNSSSSEIIFYDATIIIKNNFSPNGKVTNHGSLELQKNLNINSSAELTNNGAITIGENLNNNSTLINNNSIIVTKKVAINGGSTLTNNCKLTAGDNFTVNTSINTYGLIDVTKKITINGGASITLHDGAMVNAKDMTINGTISGTGSTSLAKVSGKTILNGGASIAGNLEYCDIDGIETNTGSITATLSCGVYIATSSCNGIGNGVPTISDSDNDGVADDNDLFPNDPDRAGESYYPGSNQFGTVAFEDLWPGQGDYDFNDVIVDYRFRLITNADNEVKDIELDYSLRAIGGSLKNGFGFQLDISPSLVESITGQKNFENTLSFNANGTEASQAKAVIIVFDNAFGVLPNNGTQTVNTDPNEAATVADTNNLRITLITAQVQSQLGDFPFNPFIYIGQDRTKEVHLSGNVPTDLMDANFFGNSQDDSDPSQGRYFVNENNLPWALDISQKFDYPKEKEDIVLTYGQFSSWAQTGGSSSSDWYVDLPGYRDAAKVY